MHGAHQLHPALAPNESPLALCTPERPLLIVVEDINTAGEPHRLMTKILQWGRVSETSGADKPRSWRLLCPIWPQALIGLADQPRRLIEPLIHVLEPMHLDEAATAIRRRTSAAKTEMSELIARATAQALGNDPLLIALYVGGPPNPHQVIGDFVEATLASAAQSSDRHLAPDLRRAIDALARQMLIERQLEPTWSDVERWFADEGETKAGLRHLVRHGVLIRLGGPSIEARLGFRHDRVRDWLLIEAGAAMAERHVLPHDMGAVLVRRGLDVQLLDALTSVNPLALSRRYVS